MCAFFFSSRRRHTRFDCDWSSDVCSSDLAAKVIEDAHEMAGRGIAFGAPQIDLPRLRAWKSAVVAKLTGGLKILVRQRKVEVVHGVGRFVSANVLEVMSASGSQRIRFDQCIIAAGSEPVRLPGWPQDPRILD